MTALAIIAASYVLGTIPVAWLTGRLTKSVDLRDYGSGNIGASNVWQSVSRALVVPVGLLQIAQGAAGVLLARAFDQHTGAQVAAGLAAIVANNWNPWLRFSGGRGVGQAIGFLLAISPVALVVFVIIALIGVVLHAIPQFVALAITLAPGGSLVASQDGVVTIGIVALVTIVMAKRVLANGLPDAERERPRVWLYRLVYDRDVRDREAWVRRGLSE